MSTAMLARSAKAAQHETCHIVTLTPDLARKWLERNTHNRKPRPGRVEQYARDMTAGRWEFNGDAIRFDHNGVMLDGQHRCHAVVKSGVTIRVLVVDNLTPEAQNTMDRPGVREMRDQLGLAGEYNTGMLAAILRRLVAYTAGSRSIDGGRVNPTQGEMREFLDTYPQVREAVVVSVKAQKYLSCAPSVVGTAYYICAECDRAAADQFFVTQLIEGIGLTATSPARALAKRLNDLGSTRGRVNGDDALRYIFVAWNAYRAGRGLTRLQAPKGGWTAANFPNPR
ncbi:hypothetical protein [Actinopolymorpha sp. B9G3]|uniref:hypothetical protein n=1 Tax=Actinopolymorpha sp. B9G3 TaxID=3158970 RepID=UPI0032D92C1A